MNHRRPFLSMMTCRTLRNRIRCLCRFPIRGTACMAWPSNIHHAERSRKHQLGIPDILSACCRDASTTMEPLFLHPKNRLMIRKSAIEAIVNRVPTHAIFSLSLSHNHSFPVNRDVSITASVGGLFTLRRPSAVFFAVWPVVVNSIDRHPSRWFAHIF